MQMNAVSNPNRAITRELHSDPATNGVFDIIIRSSGMELTPGLREAVSVKIGRVRQYAPRAFRARVQFEKEKHKSSVDRFRVAVRYELPGKDLMAEHRGHDPLAALDIVSEKIERRLRKRKTARLASRFSRRGKPNRIADFCATQEPFPLIHQE